MWRSVYLRCGAVASIVEAVSSGLWLLKLLVPTKIKWCWIWEILKVFNTLWNNHSALSPGIPALSTPFPRKRSHPSEEERCFVIESPPKNWMAFAYLLGDSSMFYLPLFVLRTSSWTGANRTWKNTPIKTVTRPMGSAKMNFTYRNKGCVPDTPERAVYW